MVCVFHDKDLDGRASGAVVKYKFPDCQLIGFDYPDPLPKIPLEEEVIMIDVTLPMAIILMLAKRQKVTVIDHHISFKKQYDALLPEDQASFTYIYEDGKAACEIGWDYFFPDTAMPRAIELIGKYDTWRKDQEWDTHVLPFQYYMREQVSHPTEFPDYFLLHGHLASDKIQTGVTIGKSILGYQQTFDKLNCKRAAFEQDVYWHNDPAPLRSRSAYKAICLNQGGISSNTFQSVQQPHHDLMVGFQFNGTKWVVSLRTDKPDIDVSTIAKERGGGGHKAAAGFECDNFEDIFK